jgi:hypothetical protein
VPKSRLIAKVHPHKDLRRLAGQPHAGLLRKIRNLIIFPKNHAQMRNPPPQPQCLFPLFASLPLRTPVQKPASPVARTDFCTFFAMRTSVNNSTDRLTAREPQPQILQKLLQIDRSRTTELLTL